MRPRIALAYALITFHVCGALAASNVPQPDLTLSAALAATPDEMRGKDIYNAQCARCHQSDAYGLSAQQVPALAGQQYEYLTKQLIDLIAFERANPTMHDVLRRGGMRDAQSIADVVGYVANLPMNPAPGRGNGKALEQGKRIFDSYCTSCHGRTGEGNADLWAPNLRGQHYGYLVKQMTAMAQSSRSNISEDLHRMFTTYALEEFEAVADYLTQPR